MNSLALRSNRKLNMPSLWDWDLDWAFEFPRRTWEAKTLENGDTQVTLELPGYKSNEISVEYQNDLISVKAEGGRGKFAQSFRVAHIDPNKIEAKLEDGVLTLTLPPREEARPRKITVK